MISNQGGQGHCGECCAPFFRPSKMTFQRVLQNQVQIDFDNENDDLCDENSNNFDNYGDENDQKTDKYLVFFSQNIPKLITHRYIWQSDIFSYNVK